MATWVAALIAVGGTLAGAALGFLGARWISLQEREERRRVEMASAFADYLASVYEWIAELRDMPSDPDPGVLEQLVTQLRGEAATWVSNRRALAKLGGDHAGVRSRLMAAMARLDLQPLPPDVRRTVDDVNDYLERLASERSDALKREWPQVHERLQSAAATLTAGRRS